MSSGDRVRARGVFGFLVELVLIFVAVFLALLANNWQQSREHQAKTQEALRNFLSEIETNLKATQDVRAYHEQLAKQLDQFLSSSEPATEERIAREVHFTGIHPVDYEHTAYDLALATQALSYLPQDLAFDVSKVYKKQASFQNLENTFLAALYSAGAMSTGNVKAFAGALRLYLGDVNVAEPALIDSYQKVIPLLKGAIQTESGDSWPHFFKHPGRR